MRPLMKVVLLVLTIALIAGCSQTDQVEIATPDIPLAGSPQTFDIPMPIASGVDVESNERASIDYSNMQDGYVIVKFSDKTDKTLRVLVTAPHGERYIYALSDGGFEEVIPLTEGEGEYEIGIYEHVDGNNYNQVLLITLDVSLTGEFAPFILPNQFVNYTRESNLIPLAAELTKNATTTEEKFEAIYNYVVDNFKYDYDLAATVERGYLPNLDEVLRKKEGICFDYSALVTAMLRSQGIPARLEIGYYGEQYHAWISKHCEENGWIDRKYNYSDGEWTMMDPTIESGEHNSHTSRQHARDDTEYRMMFNY